MTRALAHTLAAIALGVGIVAILALAPAVLLLWATGSGL